LKCCLISFIPKAANATSISSWIYYDLVILKLFCHKYFILIFFKNLKFWGNLRSMFYFILETPPSLEKSDKVLKHLVCHPLSILKGGRALTKKEMDEKSYIGIVTINVVLAKLTLPLFVLLLLLVKPCFISLFSRSELSDCPKATMFGTPATPLNIGVTMAMDAWITVMATSRCCNSMYFTFYATAVCMRDGLFR